MLLKQKSQYYILYTPLEALSALSLAAFPFVVPVSCAPLLNRLTTLSHT